jgi:hypothetical protein
MFASRALRPSLAVACLVTLAAGASGHVAADGTVVFDEAGEDAPHISLIGDSTLAGVRWWANFGDLRRYNFVLDAESCRRTVEDSCWSREDFRPDNTVTAMQRLEGRLGDVVVVMSGYNDSGDLFDDAVDAVVAEARRQAVPHVVWLTLLDHDVSYQDPQERANADGYQDDNLLLYERADALGGYLQVADWATHAWDRPEWFEYDGVHLTEEGVRGLTTFIAGRVDLVLDGGSLNPDVVPWAALQEGSDGPVVAMVQRALQDHGLTTVGVVDGVYGDQTAAAVEAFQERRGLPITGAVDEPTAVALGVLDAADVTESAGAPTRPSPRVIARPPAFTPVPAKLPDEPGPATVAVVVAALAAAAGAAMVVRPRTRPSDDTARALSDDELRAPEPYNYELEESLTG